MIVDGIFNKYLYGPQEDGYAVIRLCIERGKYIIAVSRFCSVPSDITEGTRLELEGEYNENRETSTSFTGEPEFNFNSIISLMPKDERSAIEYVLGMNIKGIQEKVAQKIIKITGPNLSNYILFHPDPTELRKAIGNPIAKATIEALYTKVRCASAVKDFHDALSSTGISYKLSYRLYNATCKTANKKLTCDEAISILSPYTSVNLPDGPQDIYDFCNKTGMLFSEADVVAKLLGYRPYNSGRIKSLTYSVLRMFAENGHTWTDYYDLCQKIDKMIPRTAYPDSKISFYAIYAAIQNNPKLFKMTDDNKVYPAYLFRDEKNAAYHAKRIKFSGRTLKHNKNASEHLEKKYGITYSETQKRCFDFLKSGGLKIITGEAGTGKTTIISGLIEAFTNVYPASVVSLCAPTGRAAQRMTELCSKFGMDNVKASTIHKLLHFEPFGDSTKAEYDEENPLDSDFIIVDEMSMVDISLFASLLKAVKDGALLILCGDAEQLPSVAAGMVFRDLISSKKFDTVRLSVNYRQAEDSTENGLIVSNAIKINEGKTNLETGNDFVIKLYENEDAIRKEVAKLIKSDSTQTLLSPIRTGKIGVNELNRVVQPIANSNKDGFVYGKTVFKKGDKVLMNRNNYTDGYVNGDVGFITDITQSGVIVHIGNYYKQVARDLLPDMTLAYAMTIHKSQGSEYDSVIIVLPHAAEHMMTRNLLYTAVTRAKTKVTILALPGEIEKAIKSTKENERRTSLKERLAA